MHKRQPHTDVSLPLFLPSFPSLKINKILKKIKIDIEAKREGIHMYNLDVSDGEMVLNEGLV